MIKQFLRIKKKHPDCLIFYRMGDFYELFFEDAIIASKIMDITLTERGKTADGEKIPMCGVPCHVYESYLYKLVKSGYRVAICEQVDHSYKDRQIRGYKKLLHREVVRVITPGTLTEDSLLSSIENSFIMSLYRPKKNKNNYYLSYIDISTGSFFIEKSSSFGISASLSRFSPKEVVLPERLIKENDLIKLIRNWTNSIVSLPEDCFEKAKAKLSVSKAFSVKFLDVLGSFTEDSWISAGSLLNYIRSTQKGILPYLSIPRDLSNNDFLFIDAATRSNLELDKSLSGKRLGSLLATIDKTSTGFGSRCLHYDLRFPLVDIPALNERYDFIDCCIQSSDFIDKARFYLKMIPDIERAVARLSLNRGGPRDLGIIKDTIYYASLLKDIMSQYSIFKSYLGNRCLENLSGYDEIYNVLSRALCDSLSFSINNGGFISVGYSKDLDLKIKLQDNKHLLIKKLKEIYIKKTSILSLKIKHNKIIGYHIEVSNHHKNKFLDSYFINRQNLSNSTRFTTYELSNLELNINKIISEISMKNLIKENPTWEIYFSGHSMGSVTSTLLSYLLAKELPTTKITVVALASPRVGNLAFKTDFDNTPNLKLYRICYKRDIVTSFPAFYYYHVGHNLLYMNNKWTDYGKTNKISYYLYNRWNPIDHLCKSYIDALKEQVNKIKQETEEIENFI